MDFSAVVRFERTRPLAQARPSAFSILLAGGFAAWVLAAPAAGAEPTDPGATGSMDAIVLALEASGELLPPPPLVDEIDGHLAAIRALDPYFETIHARPDWVLGYLSAKLTPAAWDQFLAGEYTGLDALNETYGPVEMTVLLSCCRWISIDFAQPYNSALLQPLYEAVASVEIAEPGGFVGDGDDIETVPPIPGIFTGVYRFVHGWGDCPSGCIHHHFWVFQVEDGVARLVDESGDPVDVCCLISGCRVLDPVACAQAGGTPFSGGCLTGCPIALGRSTWGRIKSHYR